MENKSLLKKNIFVLLIISLGAVCIYALPYFRYAYWDAFMKTYNLNDAQMANLQTAYGIFAMLSYLPGGYIADRVSVKGLLLFSVFSTAFGGLALLFVDSYLPILIIHAFWGVSTILTFWPALVKTTRSLASDNEQGKAFGIMEGARGVFNVLIATVGLVIFGIFIKNSNAEAIDKVVIFYSSTLVVVGVLLIFFIKSPKQEATTATKKEAVDKTLIIDIIKRPAIWLICGIVFSSYFMNISFYYFTPYAKDVLGYGAVFSGFIVVLAQYLRPLSAILGGVIGDKISITKMVTIGFIIMIVGTALILLLPTSSPSYLVLLALALIYFAMYSLQANHYALLEESKIDKRVTGVASGFISILGYLPEIVASQIAVKFINSNLTTAAEQQYKNFFMLLVAIFVVGLLFTFVLKQVNKKA